MEPSLAEVDGIPYVAWKERDADQGNFEIRVARLNVSGTDWEQPWTGVDGTSGGINHDTNQFASEPSLAAIGDVPYVAWTEQDAIEANSRSGSRGSSGRAGRKSSEETAP